MDSASTEIISLEKLVQMSDFIVKVQWSGNTHSAFPPQNPLDGVFLHVSEVLWASPEGSSSIEKNQNGLFIPEYSEVNAGSKKMRYNSSIPLKNLFGKTGPSADPIILFLVGKDFSSSRISCPGAWESVGHIDDIKTAIHRVKIKRPA